MKSPALLLLGRSANISLHRVSADSFSRTSARTATATIRRASHALAARSPSVFPDELYQAPRSWAERANPHNLIHYNKLDRGGHFAAWEQLDLFAAEMRAAFRSLR